MCLGAPSMPKLPPPPPPTPPPPVPLVEKVGANPITKAATQRASLGLSQLIIPYKGVQV